MANFNEQIIGRFLNAAVHGGWPVVDKIAGKPGPLGKLARQVAAARTADKSPNQVVDDLFFRKGR